MNTLFIGVAIVLGFVAVLIVTTRVMITVRTAKMKGQWHPIPSEYETRTGWRSCWNSSW